MNGECKLHDAGTFEVESGVVMISDPCYEDGTWCQIKLDGVKPGTWSATRAEGNRCLIACHGGLSFRPEDFTDELEGEVGVDSGQAGVFEYDHYRDESLATDEVLGGKRITGDHRWYDMVCNVTLDGYDEYCEECNRAHVEGRRPTMECPPYAGVIPYGFVSSTAHGDGGYRAFVIRDRNGLVVGILIDFDNIKDDEDDGYYEDEEDDY